jgi:hypothetical protein
VFNSVLSVKVKTFEPSQIDEARNWLSDTIWQEYSSRIRTWLI